MKLSIITINLNNAIGLKQTIDSVYCQSFVDFEYIIIDGASTDASKEVIVEFTKKQSLKFQWKSEPDTGVYNAMNKGIAMAKGEYLLFLNSGDYFVNSNVLANIFSTEITEDIICARCHVSENGNVIWTSNPPEVITFGTLYQVGLAHQSTFIRKQLFVTCGLYREDFKYNSDIDFWYKAIILNNATTKKSDVIVSDYNLDGISSKENQTEQYRREIKEILSQANFDKFLPDYDAWKAEKQNMEIYYWAKRKKVLNGALKLLYKLAIWLNKAKRR